MNHAKYSRSVALVHALAVCPALVADKVFTMTCRDIKTEHAGYGKAAAVSPTSRGDYSDSESGGWGASRAPAYSRPSSGWNNDGPAGTENGGAAMSDGPEVESYR